MGWTQNEPTSPSLASTVAALQPPEWVQEMMAHYEEHGAYRIEDVLRVLGDQTRAVEMTPHSEAKSFFGTEL